MYKTAIITDNTQVKALSQKFLKHYNSDISAVVTDSVRDLIIMLREDKYIDAVIIHHEGSIQLEKVIDEMSRNNIDMPIILISSAVDAQLMSDAINNHVDNYLSIDDKAPSEYFQELSNLLFFAIERDRINRQRDIESRRNAALVELAKLGPYNFPTVVNYALNKAIELTESEIGYVSSYDKDTDKLTMLAWSESAMARCKMKNYPMVFDVSLTGIWGVPVRTGQSLIINDYQTTNHPMKSGAPHGHVEMNRLLMVPIILDGELIGTAGVANKVRDYTSFDEFQLQLMIQEMYKIEKSITQKNKYENQISLMNDIVRKGPVGLAFISMDGKLAVCNDIATKLLSVNDKKLPVDLNELNGDIINEVKTVLGNYRALGFAYRTMTTGTKTWSVSVYESTSSNIEGYSIVMTDITEIIAYRKKAERSSRHSTVLDVVVLNSLQSVEKELKQTLDPIGNPQLLFAMKKLNDTIDFLSKYNKLDTDDHQWLSLKNLAFKGLMKDEHEIEVQMSIDGINVFTEIMFSEVFYQLKKTSYERSSEVSLIDIRFKISEGNLAIIYTDNGIHMHPNARRALGSVSVNSLGFVLVTKICESSNMKVKWYPATSGMHVEIIIPPDSYRIGE